MASQDVVSVDGVQVYDCGKHRAGRVTGLPLPWRAPLLKEKRPFENKINWMTWKFSFDSNFVASGPQRPN